MDAPIIKILAGIRRCGKSTILEMLHKELISKGIDESNIICKRYTSFEIDDCYTAKDMYNEKLSERFRYFKETEGGMGEMCKVVEERAKEYAMEQQIQNISSLLLLDKLTHEEIANALHVSVELVDEVASGKVA